MATARYVWEKWNINAQAIVSNTIEDVQVLKRNGYSGWSFTRSKTVKVSPSGSITLVNPQSVGLNQSSADISCGGYYWTTGAQTFYGGIVHYYIGSDSTGQVTETVVAFGTQKVTSSVSKGTTSYGNISSVESNAYASNGRTGNYWYISKGSDNIDPASLTYSDAVTAGQNVTLTIAPSTGTTLGGNISYVIQTTVNGTDWYDAGETSGTSYTVTVPDDAIVWNVRVYAKDDTGFTSSTYIYGNGVTTYVNVIRVGIAPDSGDIGYITSPQVMFVSINTDTDYTFTVKLDGETLSSSSSSSSTIQHIILSEEKFNSLEEETKYTLTVEIVQNGATITRTYTFQKFVYDDTSLGGVFDGAAKALRIKRKIQSQIVGANIPKEIIKIDNPIGVSDLAAATASEAQVFKGYTFFSGDNELKTGIAEDPNGLFRHGTVTLTRGEANGYGWDISLNFSVGINADLVFIQFNPRKITTSKYVAFYGLTFNLINQSLTFSYGNTSNRTEYYNSTLTDGVYNVSGLKTIMSLVNDQVKIFLSGSTLKFYGDTSFDLDWYAFKKP